MRLFNDVLERVSDILASLLDRVAQRFLPKIRVALLVDDEGEHTAIPVIVCQWLLDCIVAVLPW